MKRLIILFVLLAGIVGFAGPAHGMAISSFSGLPGPGVSESYLLSDTGHIVGFDGQGWLFEDSSGDLWWLDPDGGSLDDVMGDLFDHVMATGEELQLVVWENGSGPRVMSATRTGN
jgi:hypothetical protein